MLSDMKAEYSLPGLLVLLLMLPVSAQTIYQWEDENGQMNYSDMPREGATEIEVGPAQTFDAPVVSVPGSSRVNGEGAEASYDSLEIASPTNEETIWNTGGTVSVKMNVSPDLKSGHRIRVYLDGQSSATLEAGTAIQLKDVVRGTHSLQAEVLSPGGQGLIKSAPVTFFYKQSTADARKVPLPPVAKPTRVRNRAL